MNKICRFIGSVALFVICVLSATNAWAATISGEVEQEMMWLGRHAICGKVYELDNKELMLEFMMWYSQYIAR